MIIIVMILMKNSCSEKSLRWKMYPVYLITLSHPMISVVNRLSFVLVNFIFSYLFIINFCLFCYLFIYCFASILFFIATLFIVKYWNISVDIPCHLENFHLSIPINSLAIWLTAIAILTTTNKVLLTVNLRILVINPIAKESS